jgi:aryl-alcohol dehydrogenase-like predicted oxidoreductase
LLKLQLDQVDVLQLHNPSREAVEHGELLKTLQELKDRGACKFIGVSTTTPNMEEFIKWDVFDVFQVPYSALQRTHENLITKAGEAGAGIIIRGGVAQGEPGEGRGGQNAWDTWEKANLDELLEDGQSRTAFMLRFTMSHPYCHTTIVGTLNPEHLKQNVQTACRGPLPADVYEEAKKRLSAAGEVPLEC